MTCRSDFVRNLMPSSHANSAPIPFRDDSPHKTRGIALVDFLNVHSPIHEVKELRPGIAHPERLQ